MVPSKRATTATKLPLQLVIWGLMDQEAENYTMEALENVHTKHTTCALG